MSAAAGAPERDVPLIELRDIVKTFPGVRANDGVTFTIRRGEVHGLLGENGAGKSTLMSILYGLYQPDSGEILRDGVPMRIPSPKKALETGIAIVQQHFALVPTLSVAENVVLGHEPGRLLRRRLIEARVGELSDRYRLELDPRTAVGPLSVGQRQRVEILKCLYREPEVLIFDEPTTVLTPKEIHDLFVTIRSLAEEGKGMVLITHKLDELLDVTDRITVLRAGRSAGTVDTGATDGATLARLMVGRDVKLRPVALQIGLPGDGAPEPVPQGEAPESSVMPTDISGTTSARGRRGIDRSAPPALAVEDVHVHVAGVHRLRGVTLRVAPGEVLGLAGVEGNGQRELVQLLCGTHHCDTGRIVVDGQDLTRARPPDYAAAGVRVVTEDRHATGCVLDMTVAENLVADRIGAAPFSRRGVIAAREVDGHARDLIRQYRVRTPGPQASMRGLSGGNQQRAILARELSRPVRVLVAAQPTRGLDVGAIEEITERIVAARDLGAAVLLVSSDLAEILALSDRVAVINRGSVVGVLDRAEADPATIGELMAGVVGAGAGS